MPRKQFVADLKKAKEGSLPPTIQDLKQGEDDGQIQFTVLLEGATAEAVRVNAMIPDLSEYPSSHEYMIFSDDGASPEAVAKLQHLHNYHGKTVSELLDLIAAALAEATPNHGDDTPMRDAQLDEDLEEYDSDVDIYDSDDEAFVGGGLPKHSNPAHQTLNGHESKQIDFAFRERIRQDLLSAKAAGFKIGHLGNLMAGTNSYVTVSIRIAKLGVSQEALESWKIDRKEYLILIMQYPNGYKTNEDLQALDTFRIAANVAMRVCAGKTYKPTLQKAIKAFTAFKKDVDTHDSGLSLGQNDSRESSLREIFISGPLNNLLRDRLVPLIRYRSGGMDWSGAERFFAHLVNATTHEEGALLNTHLEPEPINETRPSIVNADHLENYSTMCLYSFPQIAMEYLLRHFVRCTEFCLVCHDHLTSDLEALKPYVCDKPLCLYQYMTLGFGPSVEHEILMQPYVVDLLVSFCYSSASAEKLKEFPDGLALTVPHVPKIQSAYDMRFGYPAPSAQEPKDDDDSRKPHEYEIGYDSARKEIIFQTVPTSCPVRKGSWIVLKKTGGEAPEMHCRISDATFFPTISIDEPIIVSTEATRATAGALPTDPLGSFPAFGTSPASTPSYEPATLRIYNLDFSKLSNSRKCATICTLLESLPDVKSMQQRLKMGYSTELKDWVERISPAALGLLRWIIASNRACIMQVDGDTANNESGKSRERLHGMNNYMQFRFAMGAPDKEQRFMQEVRSTTDRLGLKYPTIFAWHGSPLHNWHMIIREGLHYKNRDHGRAYGDGIYHAKDASTSMSYCASTGLGRTPWSKSVLRISTALALNEIVNAPFEFTSRKPYYVVPRLDWVQTRYLFVHCSPSVDNLQTLDTVQPRDVFEQDPTATPKGSVNTAIVIPASAIKSRAKKIANAAATSLSESATKKMKFSHQGGTADNHILLDDSDAGDSDATDADDIDLLRDEPQPPAEEKLAGQIADGTHPANQSETDFRPGRLEFSTLPLMPMPTYATTATTTRLMKELRSLAKTQESTPLADLGWYVDVEKIDNVYQWIVELHSFDKLDPELPLAKQMKAQKITSMVLEVRFNRDFPFTPPYIRVIRPRCLTLAQGGGGHIVMGGALCMELLTNTGWSSVSSMESVFMQVRLAIASEPHARLEKQPNAKNSRQNDYGAAEAADGYIRACAVHGWSVPPGFKEMAYSIAKE